MTHHGLSTLKSRGARERGAGSSDAAPTVKGALVIGWSGMRGIVTLAAAMALPGDFPYRGFIELTAFVVVLGTLLIQGLTLRPLLSLLHLPKDTVLETELLAAREAALKAVLAVLETDESPSGRSIKQEYSEALRATYKGDSPRDTKRNELRHSLVTVARAAIEDLRSSGTIGDTTFRRVEEELDQLELSVRSAQEDRETWRD